MNNDIIIEAWNTVLFDKFSRFKHLLIDGLSSHSNEALRRHEHPKGAKVLDIGCGFGDSTIRIARTIGKNGEAKGVDCAVNFVNASKN
jgi:ubiquinone/menaquinone biosynthesis C-methylase UbiE